jgi:hypothetical protein
MSVREGMDTLAVLCRRRRGRFGYIQCNSWRVSKFSEITMRVAMVQEGRHISGPVPTSARIPMRVTSTRQRRRQRKGKTREEPTRVRAMGY